MPSNKPKVMIYLTEEMKQQLSDWAKQEKRSVSNLATLLIEEALKSRESKNEPNHK
jgi:hypothetical protein